MIFKNIQREQIISYGSKPSSSIFDWANKEFDSPVPIKMKLVPIIDLFHKDLMQHDNELKDKEYAATRDWVTPLYENYCEDMKAELGIEFCKPGEVKRCGYNYNCNPAYEDCMQTAEDNYKCIIKVTKSNVMSLLSSAMDDIREEMIDNADIAAKLIEENLSRKLHDVEIYVFVLEGSYGHMEVAGDNAVIKKTTLTNKKSFRAAVGWASSDKVGANDNFQSDDTDSLNGETCKPLMQRGLNQ